MPDVAEPQAFPEEVDLVASLTNFRQDQDPLETALRTDDRVIARVTDGIYRQPASALRELISNAYDADASRVTIRTDRPRFQRIVVEDDGIGMSPRSLVHLLYHIGGSAKRTIAGAELGITSTDDPMTSPAGRPLIGKIGIGLFSVAQLTQAFQVITKVAGDSHRTVASVILKQYSDTIADETRDSGYEAGRVLVWREYAADTEAHGTTIVLDAIRPQTRDTLRSNAIWEAIDGTVGREGKDQSTRLVPPLYNIGAVRSTDEDLLRVNGGNHSSLPWSTRDDPAQAFRRLVDSVWKVLEEGIPNPRLEQLLDYYLNMVWNISLWTPIPYIDAHPFDLTGDDDPIFFALSASSSEHELELGPATHLRDAAGLGESVQSPADFSVTIDDLELRRPIRMRNLPTTSTAVKTPLLFVANEREEFEGVDWELSGGSLAFQAYLLWAPKIVPVDHQGVLVRVHDATGTLFDPTFLRYPVAEQRRLSQISCEIYIIEGFDGALNIDRESFNFSHPHVVALTKWLHRSLRRVISIQKRIAASALEERRSAGANKAASNADEVISRLWGQRTGEDGSEPPGVEFRDTFEPPTTAAGVYGFNRSRVVGSVSGKNWQQRQRSLEGRLEKIAQILAAYDLLDYLSAEERNELLAAVRKVLQAYEL